MTHAAESLSSLQYLFFFCSPPPTFFFFSFSSVQTQVELECKALPSVGISRSHPQTTLGAWHAAGRVGMESGVSHQGNNDNLGLCVRAREGDAAQRSQVFAKINRPHLSICIYIKAFYFLIVFFYSFWHLYFYIENRFCRGTNKSAGDAGRCWRQQLSGGGGS